MGSAMPDWLFLGDFVRLHILYHAAKKPIGGVESLADLHRRGYQLNAAKVNSILHALARAGYLTVGSEVVSGRRRKYFKTTRKGLQVMTVAKKKMKLLATELLRQAPSLSDD
jgi:DNA-binding PadR family transcriptional regulator